jgi:hypothetical protein
MCQEVLFSITNRRIIFYLKSCQAWRPFGYLNSKGPAFIHSMIIIITRRKTNGLYYPGVDLVGLLYIDTEISTPQLFSNMYSHHTIFPCSVDN